MKILMVDSDFDRQLSALLAFKKMNMAHSFDFVENGAELLTYLLSRIAADNSLPDLILMDAKPRQGENEESLDVIRGHPTLSRLPVVIYSMNQLYERRSHLSETLLGSTNRELNWILDRICGELNTKAGWSFCIQQEEMEETPVGYQISMI